MKMGVVGHSVLHQRQWRLYDEIASKGIDVHLFVPARWPGVHPSDRPSTGSAFTPHYHEVLWAGSHNRFWLRGLVGSIRRADPDVILTQNEPWHNVTAAVEMIATSLGIPHAVFTWENLYRVPRSTRRRLLGRFVLSRASGILAGSEQAAERVRDRGFEGSLAVAPQTGVDTGFFEPEVNGFDVLRTFGLPAGPPVVLFAGRLAPNKGLDRILATVPRVTEDHPGTRYLIVGEGPEAERLRSRVESGGYDQVTVVDSAQPYSRMPAVMNTGTVFLYPSRTVEGWAEQFGFAVAEAMACETPVVTTDCGYLPDVVGEEGIVCPEDDVDCLAKAVSTLIANEERREVLGSAARERVERLFGLEPVAKDHLRFLAEVRGA